MAQVKEGFCHGVSHPVNPSGVAYPDPVFADLPGDPVMLAWRAPTLPPRCRGPGLHPVCRLKNGVQDDCLHIHLGDERTQVLPGPSLDAIALTDQPGDRLGLGFAQYRRQGLAIRPAPLPVRTHMTAIDLPQFVGQGREPAW